MGQAGRAPRYAHAPWAAHGRACSRSPGTSGAGPAPEAQGWRPVPRSPTGRQPPLSAGEPEIARNALSPFGALPVTTGPELPGVPRAPEQVGRRPTRAPPSQRLPAPRAVEAFLVLHATCLYPFRPPPPSPPAAMYERAPRVLRFADGGSTADHVGPGAYQVPFPKQQAAGEMRARQASAGRLPFLPPCGVPAGDRDSAPSQVSPTGSSRKMPPVFRSPGRAQGRGRPHRSCRGAAGCQVSVSVLVGRHRLQMSFLPPAGLSHGDPVGVTHLPYP